MLSVLFRRRKLLKFTSIVLVSTTIVFLTLILLYDSAEMFMSETNQQWLKEILHLTSSSSNWVSEGDASAVVEEGWNWENHPEDSKYAKEIRFLFSKMSQSLSQEKDYQDSNNGDIPDDWDLGDCLTDSLFKHEYTPFKDYFNEETLALIDAKKPYDINPNLYWDLLLSQIINIESKKKGEEKEKEENTSNSEDELVFAWYDFVDNIEYNTLLQLSKLEGDNAPEVSCKCTNYKSIPVALVDLEGYNSNFLKAREETEEYEDEEYEEEEEEDIEDSEEVIEQTNPRRLFVKDLLAQYTSPSFLEKNKNSGYDPHQHCIDQSHKLPNFHEKSKSILQNVDNYLQSFVQFSLNSNVRSEVYGLQATSNLIETKENPMGVVLLKYGEDPESQPQFKFYPIKSKKFDYATSSDEDNEHSDILMGRNYVTLGIVDQFRDEITLQKDDLISKYDKIPFGSLPNKFQLENDELDKSVFEFNLTERINELQSQKDSLTKTQKNYLESLLFHSKRHYTQNTKHFYEANGILQFSGKGFHYDAQFFHSGKFEDKPQVRQASIHNLVQTLTYLTQSLGLNGWIAHGNLLAWTYNGLNFPWDDDVDFQMPIRDLHKLAELCNQTLIMQDPLYGNGRYWLDFGNLIGRTNGNGMNNIDARLIDVDTGLFIDITGLSYNSEVVADREYPTLRQFFTDHKNEIGDMILDKDPGLTDLDRINAEDYVTVIQKELDLSANEKADMVKKCKATTKKEKVTKKSIWQQVPTLSTEDEDYEAKQEVHDLIYHYVYSMTADQRYSINKRLNLVTCRNRHFSIVERLTKQKKTFYQRIPVNIPANYTPLIKQEYKESGAEKNVFENFIQYNKYIFLPNFKMWLFKQFVVDSLRLPHKLSVETINDKGKTSLKDMTIDLSEENVDSLDFEQTELVIANMCDLNGDQLNEILVVSDMIEQIDQKEYRFKELLLEKNDEDTMELYKDSLNTLGKSSSFQIDPFDLNLLYREYFNYDTPYKQEICLNYAFKLIQHMERNR